jgi:hypothetical protein
VRVRLDQAQQFHRLATAGQGWISEEWVFMLLYVEKLVASGSRRHANNQMIVLPVLSVI